MKHMWQCCLCGAIKDKGNFLGCQFDFHFSSFVLKHKVEQRKHQQNINMRHIHPHIIARGLPAHPSYLPPWYGFVWVVTTLHLRAFEMEMEMKKEMAFDNNFVLIATLWILKNVCFVKLNKKVIIKFKIS